MKKLYILIAVTCFLFVQMNTVNAQCNLEDWTALKAFYESTNGDDWNNRSGWDVQIANRSSPPVNCDLSTMKGVEIEDNRVKTLNLDNNNLCGSIPGAIERLTNIQYLLLGNNNLTGSIPTTIGNLTMLIQLKIAQNELIGSLPNSIGNLSNLRVTYLNYNQLSGAIPASIGNLNNLRELGLDNNQFTGSIPSEIGNLSNLQQLWLQKNNLTGSLPLEIGNLNLTGFAIAVNDLFGCFPNSLKNLCTQVENFNGQQNIDNNNDFNERWDSFCANDSGSCETVITNQNVAQTNYSGSVNIETTLSDSQDILRNNQVTIYDHCDYNCFVPTIFEACGRVAGFNNLSANEAFWAASNAANFVAPYFATYHNATLSPVTILVNFKCDPHESVYKPTTNTILLGKGDGTERSSMAAQDIVAHEYAHHILHSMENLNFANYGIPGAISESFSDIFGEVIEYYNTNGQNDWVFGGDVMANGSSYNGIRSLSNPKDDQMEYQLPNTYKGEHWIDTEDICFHKDLCGVHTNCGVHNYWFYLLANGGNGVNDNGDAYNISGIGIEKAFDIVFENLSTRLQSDVSYADVMLGSIQSAKSLFGEASTEVATAIEAWKAVGLDYVEQNPIKFSLANARQIGEVMVLPNGATDIPVQFDLTIDSLGQDLTADDLCFTLHLPEGYRGFKINQVFEPLTIQEVDTFSIAGEMNICIDRQSANAQKTRLAYERISSGEPIVSAVVCIEVIDVGGEESIVEPIIISGYTKVNSNEITSFTPDNLSFGLDVDIAESEGVLNGTIKITHENCNALGSVEIGALGNPPYTFGLKNVSNNSVNGSPTINDTKYQFDNLETGDYEIVVFDSANRKFTKEFSIEFVANLDGSFCCPYNLIIPSGISNNFYNATNTVSLSIGTLITEGKLEICD